MSESSRPNSLRATSTSTTTEPPTTSPSENPSPPPSSPMACASPGRGPSHVAHPGSDGLGRCRLGLGGWRICTASRCEFCFCTIRAAIRETPRRSGAATFSANGFGPGGCMKVSCSGCQLEARASSAGGSGACAAVRHFSSALENMPADMSLHVASASCCALNVARSRSSFAVSSSSNSSKKVSATGRPSPSIYSKVGRQWQW